MLFASLNAKAGTTWDGGGNNNNWSTNGNWDPTGAPTPGVTVDLTFAGTVRLTNTNNLAAGSDFHSILFAASAGAFSLSGNALDVFGKIENNSTATQTVALSTLSISSGQSNTGEFNPVNGDLLINSASVLTNGNNVRVFGANNKTVTFGASTVISGTGGFALEQSSNAILAGTNTYTGATTVNSGSLIVTGSIATSATTVNTGTLAGTGTTGSVALSSTATFAPGATAGSAGTLATGSVTSTAGANFLFDLNSSSSYDQVNTTGTVSLAGTLVLTLNYAAAENDKLFIWLNDGADAITGTFTGLAEGAIIPSGSGSWQISYIDNSAGAPGTGNDISLKFIPEPGTWSLAIMALLAALNRRRR